MLKKAHIAALFLAGCAASSSYAEQASNPFLKPSVRNPVEATVEAAPMCAPEEKEAYETQISMLEEEKNLLSLRLEESSARLNELEAALEKSKRLEAQKFIGIVNDKAIFFDEINKVYIYKNKNEIDGELLK